MYQPDASSGQNGNGNLPGSVPSRNRQARIAAAKVCCAGVGVGMLSHRLRQSTIILFYFFVHITLVPTK
jgi:hypothetical protein